MKSINVWILPLFLIICFSTHVDAQKKKRKLKSDTNNPDRVEIKMKDGEIYIGKLIKLDVDSIIIDHEKLGRLALPRIDVKKSIDLDENDFFKEEGWKKEKYQGQYFISPTARPIGEDTRYYTNFNIFVNTFSFGLTDNFSLTAGFEGYGNWYYSIHIECRRRNCSNTWRYHIC